jgi:hypothetical protein
LGWVSDRIGREMTMFLRVHDRGGSAIFALMVFGRSPVSFVLLSGLVFFAWGEIYSIFPSTARDHFGQKYATTNYGMLYTAKGTGVAGRSAGERSQRRDRQLDRCAERRCVLQHHRSGDGDRGALSGAPCARFEKPGRHRAGDRLDARGSHLAQEHASPVTMGHGQWDHAVVTEAIAAVAGLAIGILGTLIGAGGRLPDRSAARAARTVVEHG